MKTLSLPDPKEFVMPTPNAGEGEADFISRCMANDTMLNEYPDSEQRAAVCYAQLKTK